MWETIEPGMSCSLEKMRRTNFKTYNTIFTCSGLQATPVKAYMSDNRCRRVTLHTLSRHHKMSYSISLSMRTLFTTTWTDLWLG